MLRFSIEEVNEWFTEQYEWHFRTLPIS